jgi:effector-binding domain-containing protein
VIETPTILKTSARRAAFVHIVVARAEIQKVMGPGISELRAVVEAQGIKVEGPWFNYHRQMNPQTFDFQIGLPIATPIVPTGRVTNGELPAATVARAIYRGDYGGLFQAWPALDAWIVEQGRTPGPALWETYLVDPSSDPDPSHWQTELTRPLA